MGVGGESEGRQLKGDKAEAEEDNACSHQKKEEGKERIMAAMLEELDLCSKEAERKEDGEGRVISKNEEYDQAWTSGGGIVGPPTDSVPHASSNANAGSSSDKIAERI